MVQDVQRAIHHHDVSFRIDVTGHVEHHIVHGMHIRLLINHDDHFIHAICPAPDAALITLRAWYGYSFLILTKAQEWKTPNIGRS